MGLMTSDQIDEMYDTAYKVGYKQGVRDFADRVADLIEYSDGVYEAAQIVREIAKEMTEENK